eukprot:maker-scaffold114_size351134-snap-gene-0.14 protein:Tk09542 transcript:maker-scaffold114_size351134-snap-gene-0.14-mRNA-1 annotation:"hypothetical protein LOTGIDRAFT_148645"
MVAERLLAVRLLAVRLLAVRLLAVRLLAVRLLAVRLLAVRLLAVRLLAVRLLAVRLLAVRLLAVRLLAVRLLAVRLLTVRLLTVRLLTVRLLTVRLLTVRLLTVRLLTVRLLTVRLLTVRLLTVRLLTTFQEAQADCQHTGGKLFEPQSKLDQDLVLFNPNAASVNFIGIVKQGSNFVYASTHGSLTITPDFMPNHPVGGRNCLLAFVPPTRIYSHRTWIDADCAGRQPYICEQKNSANCAFENTLFVGEFGPSQPHGVCSIKCKYDAECKFFIIRASDGACALRNFTPSTTRLPVPGLSSGLKGDSAASGLLVAKVMPAYYPLQCQNLCQADDQCQSAIFDARASLCTFNYATLDKKLPLPAQSYRKYDTDVNLLH